MCVRHAYVWHASCRTHTCAHKTQIHNSTHSCSSLSRSLSLYQYLTRSTEPMGKKRAVRAVNFENSRERVFNDSMQLEAVQALSSSSSRRNTGASKPKLRRQLRGNWVELETPDGDVYFANIVTKETSWDMPAAAEEEAGNKENAVPEAAAMSPAPHKPERVTESRPTVPLGWSSHNANGARFNPDAVNETKAHDQSLAALNDIPALSFMRSPDRAPAPAPTAATGQNVQRSQLAGPTTSWIPGLSAKSKLNTSIILDATMMEASFVGRESDAISDLAALADMNDMTILPGGCGGGSVHGGGGGGVADMTLVSSSFPEFVERPSANDGELCGVGVILEQMQKGTGIIVEKVFAGGPAHLSGKLQEGDEIVSVNGCPINGRTPSDLKVHVVGPSGTSVSLGVRKKSTGLLSEVLLTRGPTPPEHKVLLHQKPHLSPVHTHTHTHTHS